MNTLVYVVRTSIFLGHVVCLVDVVAAVLHGGVATCGSECGSGVSCDDDFFSFLHLLFFS